MTMNLLRELWTSLGGRSDNARHVEVVGLESLRSVFRVTELASASVGAAALSIAELIATRHGTHPGIRVDRRLSSLWFGTSLRPDGWTVPSPWDSIAGDYRSADGWIKLHTNAPPHRQAALAVLNVAADKAAIADAVAGWAADRLEAAIVDRGGCAAAMRGPAEWAVHPQGLAVGSEPLFHLVTTAATSAPQWAVPRASPLAGIRVLDLTRVLAGPVATRFLAGYGADVLRIDPPWWEEPGVVPEVTLGKRCARLNITDAAQRRQFEDLLSKADVLVHGYRPGALAHLGFDAEKRRAIRPGLIDVSLDAYGWTGPWAGRRGFDSLVQMSSGIAEAGMRGMERDRPTPLPVQALDHAAGYLVAAAAIRGVTTRLSTGQGLEARTSLARVAAVLIKQPADPEAAPIPAEEPGDLAETIEATEWGPARRLLPPVSVEGASMIWTRPAAALGSSDPAW